ncbi:MAG: AmmeMemoRadiSam system protein B [Deltaproteobacteria bacterium]|nr:AmmeMemoRadiSam system protein B [Deltaproteobacteria bacterium]
MKGLCIPLFQAFLALSVCLSSAGEVCSDDMRRAVWAGSFYPAEPSDLKKAIERYTVKAGQTHVVIPSGKPLRALILPHAGYIYSGLTAAHSSLVLKENQFKKIVLIGPDHRVGFTNCALTDAEAYDTPLGPVKLHPDAERLRSVREMFRHIPASDKSEHSIEVVIPFLQRYVGQFEIVPVVAGFGDAEGISSAIASILDNDTLVVVSSDLSHFLPYEDAVKMDKETIDMILQLDIKKISGSSNRACGKIPLLVLLNTAASRGWEPLLLHYSNSGDTAGDKSRVVGYAAIAFYGNVSVQDKGISGPVINQDQGRALVRLARKTIMERFGRHLAGADADSLKTALKDEIFNICRGTFVTLTIGNELRGCIGSIEASEPIRESVRRNAIRAAFNDFRFMPLSEDEVDQIDIEVSILTEPLPLDYADSSDLTARLSPKTDGVIIKKGSAAATFLPQVWGRLPQPELFLSQLCRKAGLQGDAWRDDRLEVSTYQVQHFEEK